MTKAEQSVQAMEVLPIFTTFCVYEVVKWKWFEIQEAEEVQEHTRKKGKRDDPRVRGVQGAQSVTPT